MGLPPDAGSGEGGFGSTLPASVRTVRFVFRSAAGFSCCVSLDPAEAPLDPDSSKRFMVLDSLPFGPGTIQVSGFPTAFAPAPDGVAQLCANDPDIGRVCSSTRLATPSFDSSPLSVNIKSLGDTDAGDIVIEAVPFLLIDALQPGPNTSVSNPVPMGFTVVDAITGIDHDSVAAALLPIGGSRRNLDLTLHACDDGTANPCSPGSRLNVSGFIATAGPQVLAPGRASIDISARNLASSPAVLGFEYSFTVAPVITTPTAPALATPTPVTPATQPSARTRTPTPTATSGSDTPRPATVTPGKIPLAFIRATSFPISPEPSYIAVGDFNNDGRDDVGITSPESKELHILLGNPDGSFTPGTVARFGTFPGAIAAGDLNGDAFVDLAVADERDGGVYLMFGGPNASFTTPKLRSVGRRPVGVAIGNFDGQPGNDLAVTDRDANRVLFLLSDGKASPIFRNGGNAAVGAEPADIVTADFTGDGTLDIATLNNGGAEVKDVTILGFNRVEAGLVIFTRLANLVVGDRPLDLSVAELNSDGRPDLVMLNRPANDGFGEVNALLSRPGGLLTQTDPFVVHCPDRNLNCRARALTVGDFDNDGVSDVALTLNQAGQGLETDVMTVLLGSGDGSFIPGPTLPTEGQPLAMAAGDITGDGFADVIVTSAQTNAVQVYVNVSGQD